MATKRPAETVAQSSDKRLKCNMPQQDPSEASATLELFNKQFHQEGAQYEKQQEQNTAVIEQNRELLAIQNAKITALEADLIIEKAERREESQKHQCQESVTAQKVVELESDHAAQMKKLEEKDDQDKMADSRTKEIDRLQNLVQSIFIREKDVREQTKADKIQIHTLQRSLEKCQEENTEMRARCNGQKLEVEKAISNAKSLRRRGQELINSQAVLTRENYEFEREVRSLEKERVELKQKYSDDTDCLLEALSATSKIREVTKGMQLGNMGPFGAAHANLRDAWTTRVRSLLSSYTAAQNAE